MTLGHLPLRDQFNLFCAFPDKTSFIQDHDWEEKDADGNTLLHFAAASGGMFMINRVLALDSPRLDCSNNAKRTPLSLAAEAGQQLVVELLIDYPTDEIAGGHSQYAALMYAVAKGHEGIVRLLLPRHGVIADIQDPRPELPVPSFPSPLIIAAQRGDETIFQLLADACPDLAVTADDKFETPLFHACRRGHEGVVRYILGRFDENADTPNSRGYTPLMQAAKMGYEAIVKLLLDRWDVNPNARDKHGWTPLIWSAPAPTTARLLLACDSVDINAQAHDGRSALMNAIKHGREGEEVFKLLLAHPDINVRMMDCSHKTPLHYAALLGNYTMVKMLLDRSDLDINCEDSSGRSALSHAAQWGNIEVVKLMLSKEGIDANSRCHLGSKPMTYATMFKRNNVVDLMKAMGYSLTSR